MSAEGIRVGLACTDDFRSTPVNRHRYRASGCLKCAKSRHLQHPRRYSTSSHSSGLSSRTRAPSSARWSKGADDRAESFCQQA